AKKFSELAQWINYNGYRGMFEGRSMYRQGLLLWMSHPCWPSMVWQTYDYYFDPTAAYFGCKKASEPVHIQWNSVFDTIEVVNYNGRDRKGLTAKAQLLNMDGSVQSEKETTLDCKEDMTFKCFRLDFPQSLSAVHFIKLTLKDGDKTISENFYWRGLEDGNYQALNQLPKVELGNKTKVTKSGEEWLLTTDNYVSLMPGDEKVITMKLKNSDTRGEKPKVEISGFNL
ncbi:MAG: beta-glycosidase, partial [Bacteroidia bacterium]|nr:beta-glycosidase [Bacteroidia bacterium]